MGQGDRVARWWSGLWRLMRPRQWVKNLAVFAGVVFSGNLTNPGPVVVSVGAFAAFCVASSAVYVFNDVLDVELDRMHPVKCDRPLACGRVTRRAAILLGVGLLASAGLLAALVGSGFAWVLAAYLLLQTLYVFGLKSVSIVDILVIATGFVLRAVAGAVAIQVVVSPWLILCTGLLALFLAAAKRRHEVASLSDASGNHRPVLREYNAQLLDSFMILLSAAAITSYSFYTFMEVRAPHYSMMFTIPFVIYGMLRYQQLVLTEGQGGQPEEILLSDRPLKINLALWVVCSCALLYAVPG